MDPSIKHGGGKRIAHGRQELETRGSNKMANDEFLTVCKSYLTFTY